MNTKQLAYLIQAVQSNSIKAAAEHFQVSYQAVDSAIRKLEKEMNVKIIQKNNAEITLSEQGKIVYDFARKIMAAYTACRHETAKKQCVAKDMINISATAIPMYTFLQDIFKNIAVYHSHIFISSSKKSNREIVDEVFAEKILCGFVVQHTAVLPEWNSESSPIYTEVVKKDRSYVVMSKKHALAGSRSVLPSDLQKYPLAICQALGNQLPPYVAQDPELITSFDEPAMFEARLKDNNSLGLITKSLIDGGGFFKEKDDLSFIPLANKTQPQIIMLVNKAQKKRHEQAFEIFYQYLKNLS